MEFIMRNRAILLATLFVSFSAQAFSSKEKTWQQKRAPAEAQAYEQEIEAQRKSEDAALNEVWKKIQESSTISKEHKASLKQAQVFWISYREKECIFEASYFSSPQLYSVSLKGCELELTMKRVEELKQVLNFVR